MQTIKVSTNYFARIERTDEYIKSETYGHPTVTSTPKEALLHKISEAFSKGFFTQEELLSTIK